MTRWEYIEKVHMLKQESYRLDVEGWLQYELFTFPWWILLAFFICPWLLWFALAKSSMLMESLLFGALIIIPTTYLDAFGLELEFWIYPIQFLPLAPRAIPFDMSMVPVAFMLIHQYFSTWKTFSMALLVMSTLFAFVGEPFSVWLELVQYHKWNYVYSFLYYIGIGLTVRWIIVKIKSSASA
ncbi:CBO0543 family protein [Sutcliffiella deserti]|uniref:CBO0543 family protein n=1 Tax=Sutcliffiella deserti TaxID=2875501 RepID=UPI001CBD4E84|nr:CBO0543 family protein [Sutcliffiella deserti]